VLTAGLPRRGNAWRSGALSVGVLFLCSSANARTLGAASMAASVALLAVLAALLAAPAWPVPLSGTGWALPTLALLAAPAVALVWHRRTRAAGAALLPWRGVGTRASDAQRPVAAALPAGLDRASLLAAVNPQFVLLQTAWDQGDLATLRALTTPSMYDDIARHLAQRGPGPNRTDVLTLESELIGVEQVGPLLLASVQFSGMLREASDGGAVPFREVWMLTRASDDAQTGWRLARQQALW
jgi:hypothetical protein